MTPTITIRPTQLAARPPKLQRGSYYIQTWGCQMNEEDSEQLGLSLQSIGFVPADSLMQAQVVLLNTCSVRKKPEDKAFSMLGELAILKEIRQDLIVGVCGCMAQIRADEIRKRAPHVDFVLGTGDLSLVGSMLEETLQQRQFRKRVQLPERKGNLVSDIPQRHLNRAASLKSFVPIQYGCDKFCAFCIVPSTRGRERSRPTEHIVEEIQNLVARGTREVTLLGQTVNSYGKNLLEGRVPFSRLLWKLSETEGLERLRFTSPYPRDFKSDLIDTIRDCTKVMEHVHLPLQSGDDDILRAMKRVYSVAGFREIVANLRSAVPHISITTDIIVGFPGETDENFANTLSLVEELRFDGAFMFSYSPRPGTPASSMPQVDEAVKKKRLNALIDLQNGITGTINEGLVGKTFEVLVEGASPKDPDMLQGYSREFKMMHFHGDESLKGRIIQVEATEGKLWGLKGRITNQP